MSRFKRVAKWYGYVSDILTPSRIGLILGAALLLAVGLFGGWGAVDEAIDEVPVVETDEQFGAAPFEITVVSARVFDELEGYFPAEEGSQYIAVSLKVENVSDRPVSSYILSSGTSLGVSGLATVELDSGPQPRVPQVVRLADGLSERTFQPGLPVEILLVWQQDVTVPQAPEVGVSFSGHIWRKSVMDGTFDWRNPAPAAQIALPLKPVEGAQ